MWTGILWGNFINHLKHRKLFCCLPQLSSSGHVVSCHNMFLRKGHSHGDSHRNYTVTPVYPWGTCSSPQASAWLKIPLNLSEPRRLIESRLHEIGLYEIGPHALCGYHNISLIAFQAFLTVTDWKLEPRESLGNASFVPRPHLVCISLPV